MVGDWRDDLQRWLDPFVVALRHKTRGRMCPAYIARLIGPGDRKSVQPMAARDTALAARKSQGARLGNPRNANYAASLGRAAQAAEADRFASNVLPIVDAIRASAPLPELQPP